MKKLVVLFVLTAIAFGTVPVVPVLAGEQESISSFPVYLEGVTPRGGATWKRMFQMLMKKETAVFSYPYSISAASVISIPATPSFVIITSDGVASGNSISIATSSACDGQLMFISNRDANTTTGDIALTQGQVGLMFFASATWHDLDGAGTTALNAHMVDQSTHGCSELASTTALTTHAADQSTHQCAEIASTTALTDHAADQSTHQCSEIASTSALTDHMADQSTHGCSQLASATYVGDSITADNATDAAAIATAVTNDNATDSALINTRIVADNATDSALIDTKVTADNATDSALIDTKITNDNATDAAAIATHNALAAAHNCTVIASQSALNSHAAQVPSDVTDIHGMIATYVNWGVGATTSTQISTYARTTSLFFVTAVASLTGVEDAVFWVERNSGSYTIYLDASGTTTAAASVAVFISN